VREADLAIVGAGVAGLSAAIVAAQHGLSVLVIERMGAGGQVMNVETIHNMPGFPQGVSGFELGPLLQEQAEAAGAEFTLDTVIGIHPSTSSGRTEKTTVRPEPVEGKFLLDCESEQISARAVLVAAGSARRKLNVPGEELEGRGVSHCASCDGPMFRGQPVVVVGGGDSAFGEAALLASHASKVAIVFPGAQPHAQDYLVQAVSAFANVELVPEASVIAINGDEGVTGVKLRTEADTTDLPAQGVFVYAGLQADSGFLGKLLKLDSSGRIETSDFASSVPGIFAAGDIRSGAAWLLASAAGEGAAAALAASNYLKEGDKQ
jgi:thioredoxin reductase (NADPH)